MGNRGWAEGEPYRTLDPYQRALDALESGQIICVPYLDSRHRRALTRALISGARERGFDLDYRDGPRNARAFRRTQDPRDEGED